MSRKKMAKVGGVVVASALVLSGGIAVAGQASDGPPPSEPAAAQPDLPTPEVATPEEVTPDVATTHVETTAAAIAAAAAEVTGENPLKGRIAQALLVGEVPEPLLDLAAERLGVSKAVLTKLIDDARTRIAQAYGKSVPELAADVAAGTLPPLSEAKRQQLITELKELRAEAGLPSPGELRAKRAEQLGVPVDTLRDRVTGVLAGARGMSVEEFRAAARNGTVEPLTPDQRREILTKVLELRDSLGTPQS